MCRKRKGLLPSMGKLLGGLLQFFLDATGAPAWFSACYRHLSAMMHWVALVVLLCWAGATAFKWDISEELPYDRYFTFSERYMFADRNGPALMDQGPANIKINMDVNSLSKQNRTITIGMAIYSAAEGHHGEMMDDICIPTGTYPWANYVETALFPTRYAGTVGMAPSFMGMNGTYFMRTTQISYNYKVRAEGWYNVVFVVCWTGSSHAEGAALLDQVQSLAIDATQESRLVPELQDGRTSSALLPLLGGAAASQRPAPGALLRTVHSSSDSEVSREGSSNRRRLDYKKEVATTLTGTIAFRNPYGYIPAELYGLLPFQTARVVAYTFFFVFFVGHYYTYRDAAIHLHTAFLAVFLFAMVEATLWFASYQSLNITGEPYCCPFPPIVIASLVLQVIRQTFSRTLLLVVCLGYGIVRPKLMTAEWMAVSVMSGLYLVAAIVAQGAVILFAAEAHGDFSSVNAKLTPYKVPATFLDVFFLTWIYLAINATIRVLTEFQQTVKLNMYRQLVGIIGFFAAAFMGMTVIFMLDGAGYNFVPWQCAWLEQVIWESLNFAVLAAVCVVCRPTPTSRMLSYAAQLPTEDPDLDDDTEAHGGSSGGGGGSGPWSPKRGFVYGSDDEEGGGGGGGGQSSAYYDVGRYAASQDQGEVEMSKLPTRNPITSGAEGLGRLGKGRAKKTTTGQHGNNNGSSSGFQRPPPPGGSRSASTSGGFDSLPQAEGDEESEYGLEQDDDDL